MNLSDKELELIKDTLNRDNPSKEEITILHKIDKELTKHNWKVDGSPGLYDSNYICTKCKLQDFESMDNSHTKPEFGCPGEEK